MNMHRKKIYNFYADIYYNLCKQTLRKIHSEKISVPDNFTVTYHSGALNTKHNTVNSINAALIHGAEIIEVDVSFRPNGAPVIIHNSTPGNDQGVFLENALEAVAQSPKCMINLDIKSTANVGAIDELVKMYGLTERVFYTGVFEDFVEAVRNNSEIPYYLNHSITEEEAISPSAAQSVAEKAIALGAIGINANYTPATEMFVETMHKNNLLVSLWTVNNLDDMLKVLKLRPDNITTLNPHILNKLISDYSE